MAEQLGMNGFVLSEPIHVEMTDEMRKEWDSKDWSKAGKLEEWQPKDDPNP